jgi:hypothetical protein
MSIWMRTPERSDELNPEHLSASEYHSIPSHWTAALAISDFDNIEHLDVQIESYRSQKLCLMPKELPDAIIEFLGRAANNNVPRLTLRGFQKEAREQLPADWEVVERERKNKGFWRSH